MTRHVTSTASGNADRPYDAEDLCSRAFWSTTMDEREKTFALAEPEPACQFRWRRHSPLPGQPARPVQLRALYTEMLTRAPQITAGDAELMPGNFFHVVKGMSCRI